MKRRERRRREQKEKRQALKRAARRRKGNPNYPGDSGYGDWVEISHEDVPAIIEKQQSKRKG